MEEIVYYLERNLMVKGIEEHRTKAESTLDAINESETVSGYKEVFGSGQERRGKTLGFV
ncbi:hypothetical protein [Marinifilum fragile]